MFLNMLARRARRVLLCIKRSLVKAAAFSFLCVAVQTVYYYFTSGGDGMDWFMIFNIIITSFIASAVGATLLSLRDYKGNLYHRTDDDLIGNAFTGLGKKSLMFEKGLELFGKSEFRNALEVFTDLGSGSYKLTQREIAVNEFYRGRCYDILDAKPNALICYEKSRDNGFDIPELPIFIGRSMAANGSTDRAAEFFQELLREDYLFHERIRFEIGSIYLKAEQGETALKWFTESIEKHEKTADALGGAALASVMTGNCDEGERYFRQALVNNISDPVEFTAFFKEMLNSAERSADKKQ